MGQFVLSAIFELAWRDRQAQHVGKRTAVPRIKCKRSHGFGMVLSRAESNPRTTTGREKAYFLIS
jgi:hypothetical protein